MLVLITVENGVKKIIPLTADAGAGNPVGSLLHTYKKSNPSGYLYCDGSTFDQTKYPLLYAYLGSNVLPDYRECVEVGAEQNTTDTIATHDVYTEGQFKDDQLQEHTHHIYNTNPGGTAPSSPIEYTVNNGSRGFEQNIVGYVKNARTDTTTHGKQKAVFVYIKATSGLSENAQDNVINTLNEQRSYSTEEVNTGKKWIDGKDIYSNVVVVDSNINNYAAIAEVPIDTIVSYSGMIIAQDGNLLPLPWVNANVNESFSVYYVPTENKLHVVFSMTTPTKIIVSIEYTKTV